MSDVNHSERAHSQWGASSAHRWMACPGSVKLIEEAPKQGSSSYASEGTCSHELAEHTIRNSGKCEDYIGMEWEGHTVDQEMADYVQIYVDYVLKASEGENKDLILEEKFHLNFIRDGLFGSNDACVLEFMGTLEVIDLKYGKGVEVQAEGNKQLMYYALGAAYGGDFERIKLTIIQPRVQNPIKSVEMSMTELDKFADDLGSAVDATKVENAKLEAGSHCRFCAAKSICPAQREKAQELARMDFAAAAPITEKSLPDPSKIDEVTLKNILDHADSVKKWLDSVSSYALSQLEKGMPVKGYKLVEGRSNRKVSSTMELEMAFGEGIYENKVMGIGKLEKKFGAKEIAPFLIKPQGKMTLAPEHDKRPAVQTKTAAELFNDTPVNNDKSDNYDNFEF